MEERMERFIVLRGSSDSVQKKLNELDEKWCNVFIAGIAATDSVTTVIVDLGISPTEQTIP